MIAAAVFLAALREGQAMAVYAAWLGWAQASSEIAMSRAATETAVAASCSTLREAVDSVRLLLLVLGLRLQLRN